MPITKQESKICKKCKEARPLTKFMIMHNTGGKRGHTCRLCSVSPEARARHERTKYERHKEKIKERAKLWRVNNPERAKETQARCYEAKKDERLAKCKEYYQENKERIDARNKSYRARNIERSREVERAWREANAPKIAAYRVAYYENNKERIAAQTKVYREANRERCRLISRLRDSRERANGGSFTLAEWLNLCELYDHKCLACGKRKPLTIDHIVPVTKGGSGFIDNIQPLCGSCNSKKSTKTIDYRPKRSAA